MIPVSPEREVYPNAPLRLVTAEYRYPLSARLSTPDLLTILADSLGPSFPIIEPALQGGIQFSFGPSDPSPQGPQNGFRLLVRDRTSAVTVTPSRIAIETTSYQHWEEFRDGLISTALGALGDEIGALAGIDRVGLRYINEVRVPQPLATTEEWEEYINADLLAAARLVTEGSVNTVQTALHLQIREDQELLLRCGMLAGRIVEETGPLRLPTPPGEGPFFLIDIDSFWTRSGPVSEWDTGSCLEISNQLHSPIDGLFERCITEKLRTDVLRSAV